MYVCMCVCLVLPYCSTTGDFFFFSREIEGRNPKKSRPNTPEKPLKQIHINFPSRIVKLSVCVPVSTVVF